MNPTVSALLICLGAAALESALAGSGVRQRLTTLRMPAYSPPFPAWVAIGIVYYVICFVVLRHLLASAYTAAVVVLLLVLLANALWNVFFFRWRDLRTSFVMFIPYAALVATLVLLLSPTYPLGAALFTCYGGYLVYAMWWAYRVWVLNSPNET